MGECTELDIDEQYRTTWTHFKNTLEIEKIKYTTIQKVKAFMKLLENI